MSRRSLRRPSPAMIVSIVALVVALGGTSYAAFKLPKNSVGTKQLKKNAVTTPKIKNKAVTKAKLNLTGVTAPNAQHADTATSADPAAFARVSAAGALDAANSKNVGSVTPGPASGYYCIKGIPFTPRGGQATVDYNASGSEFAQFAVGAAGGCPAGTQAFVNTRLPANGGGATSTSAGFFVELYR